jgi:hypothetical protein
VFWWGNLRVRDHLGDPGVDGRIILRWIFRNWDFHAYINEMHDSRSKIPSKKSRPYMYFKFLALLGAIYIYIYIYIYDSSRLRVNKTLIFSADFLRIFE